MALRPPDLLFVPAHVLPLVRPKLSLVTVHDLGYIHFPRAHPLLQRLYLHLSTWWNTRAATHVLADSQLTKDDLVRRYRVPPDKVTVAHLGYDRGLAPPADPSTVTAAKDKYGIPDRYYIYLGTLQPRKNLTLLVDALAAARPNTSLVLVGRRGWMYEDLYARVRQSGMEDRIIMPGYIPQEDKPALLSGAIGFLFPSLYEGFGLPVLEAQACDCPVVCSNTSSLPEVAGDGALLIDPDDVAGWARAMNRLHSEPELRNSLVEKGRTNLRRFSWERCAETAMSVIESLVASRS
jgi:glycosyltransferase involved in cell wall biosynthesis